MAKATERCLRAVSVVTFDLLTLICERPRTIAVPPNSGSQPIICSLTPGAFRARREGLLSDLLKRAQSREARPLGHRLQFKPADDTLALIAQTIATERECCRFLRFSITLEPDGGPILLELTGPPGTREFTALFDE